MPKLSRILLWTNEIKIRVDIVTVGKSMANEFLRNDKRHHGWYLDR